MPTLIPIEILVFRSQINIMTRYNNLNNAKNKGAHKPSLVYNNTYSGGYQAKEDFTIIVSIQS